MTRIHNIIDWFNSIEWRPETVTAAGTLVLAVGSLFLWLSTRRLVRVAKDTAERQLRAYVHIEHTGWAPPTGRPGQSVLLTIKNYGTTPAYHVEMFVNIKVIIESGRQFPDAARQRGTSIMAPGQIERVVEKISPDISAEVRKDIEEFRAALYVWGTILYRDAFSAARTTKFRFRSIGDDIVSGDFETDEEGNEAN